MTGRQPDGSGSGGGDEPISGRAAIGYDHGYDAEVFYLGLALDPAYIEGFVEGCLERIGEDDPEGEEILRGKWEEGDRDMVLEVLKAECKVRTGRPNGRSVGPAWRAADRFPQNGRGGPARVYLIPSVF